MSLLVNPYLATDISLIFYGAPHDMDHITCNVCRPLKAYNNTSIIVLCTAMKKFCYNQMVCSSILQNYEIKPKFMIDIPSGTKSWSFIITNDNDDIPDIVPIFHNVEKYGELLETVTLEQEKREIKKMQLELELAKNAEEITTCMNIKNHILYGVPFKEGVA
jgi:hypothetical protein